MSPIDGKVRIAYRAKRIDFADVVVDADYIVTHVRETCPCNETNIARADN